MAKPVEFFFWFLPPPPGTRRKPSRTRWRMTRAEALRRYPDATPDLGSLEVRMLPESSAEVDLPAVGRDGVRHTFGIAQLDPEKPVDKSADDA